MLAVDCLNPTPAVTDDAIGRSSLIGLLRTRATLYPDHPALLGLSNQPLTYARLLELAEAVGRSLASFGIARGDRVALALPNGPDAAACFLTAACRAACAPLNPAGREADLDFFLADLKVKAVIVPEGASPARAAAKARGLPVLELAPAGEAGAFHLHHVSGPAQPAPHQFAAGDDLILLLHTSGTTARPKLVPLRQDAVCAAVESIAASLALTPADRCLNVMPLFHLHALSVLLASLAVGSAVACPPPFDPDRFFDWLDVFAPTWYSASPTLHQAILERAPAHADVVARRPLRLIRSISASLPPTTLAGLERAFAAPVIEAFGTTESPSQITSNPLAGPRKLGSVGLVTGPETAILDEAGRPLPAGKIGAVGLRGPHVLKAYENNPEANASAFLGGWFLTGDLGYFDADGYLYLTGRAKEVINKGGEKIAPREVEEALLAHPAVAQAVAFALPHPRLGEDVASAVVLRPGQSVQAVELRTFVAARLAEVKTPRLIVFLADIPKGPTGKVQRVGMAERLGLTRPADAAQHVGPRTPTEVRLAEMWAQALGVERVGVRDDFFLSGGDSLLAACLLGEVEKRFGKRVEPAILLEEATVERVAAELEGSAVSRWTSLAPLQSKGSRPPFYLVHGIGGELLAFAALVKRWDADQPLYGLHMPTVEGVAHPFDRIEEMAGRYIEEIRTLQPEGPYYLGGYSFGAKVAFEMGCQLRARGQEVALVALLDAEPGASVGRKGNWGLGVVAGILGNLPAWFVEEVVRKGPRKFVAGVVRKVRGLARRAASRLGLAAPVTFLEAMGVNNAALLGENYRRALEAHTRARQAFRPRAYPGCITLIRGRARPLLEGHEHDLGWGAWADGSVEVHVVPGSHDSMLHEPHLGRLVEVLLERLREAQASGETVF